MAANILSYLTRHDNGDTVRHMDKRVALRLWGRVRSGLLDAKAAIIDIIEQKAWEPLGYASFKAAWEAQMADVDLATVAITHIVYAMLAEGESDGDIAKAVKGVQVGTVSVLRRQRGNGVPADQASLHAPTNNSGKGSGSRGTLFLHVGPERLTEWNKLARERDTTTAEMAMAVLIEAFDNALLDA